MPDLFQKDTARDKRFRDSDEPDITTIPPTVEPMLAKNAKLPIVDEIDTTEEHIQIDEDPITPVVRDEEHSHIHLFSAYAERPQHITFHNQDKDEVILLFLRGTLIRTISWIIPGICFLLAPIVFFMFFPFASTPLSQLPAGLAIIILFTYYHIVITYFFVKFLRWYFNICLITTKRIVDIDFVDLVYKNVAETKLALVQDVSYTQSNATNTIFDYGNILIQTAGTIENFELHSVPKPERVVEILENLIGKGREQYGV